MIGATGATGATGLTGADGIDGAVGADGISAYQVWLHNGNVGPEVDFLSSLIGATGVQGPAGVAGIDGAVGVDGISAYQVWLNDGNVGLETDFLSSLVGATGTTGATGPAGTYAAGTGIDITTAGVISATSIAPEHLFVQPDAIVGGYVGFGSAGSVNGVPYDSVSDDFTLKAGKTYILEGAIYMNATSSAVTYSFVFFDKTNNASIGSESFQRSANYSGMVINQPTMNAIVTPITDIKVGIKDIYGSIGGFIPSRGFIKVVELK